ncbi:MAG: hypothetical protein GY799_13065 [Desulfobulbaceae bacterium]|nr:hypothetical protein [Desulfobulbaceae bacterium]
MAVKDAIEALKSKTILGEYGAVTRPFVVLDIDEYNLILKTLEKSSRQRKIPRETHRTAAV